MPVESPRFRRKSPDVLREQVKQSSDALGVDITHRREVEPFEDIPLADLKKRFPVRYSAYLRSLRELRGAGDRFSPEARAFAQYRLKVLNNLTEYIQLHENGERTLYPHQFEAFRAIEEFLEHGGKSGYIQLPTGTGKTVLFAEVAEAMGVKTLVLVPKIDLAGQTHEKFATFAEGMELGVRHSQKKTIGRDGMIMTYETFLSLLNTQQLDPRSFGLIIADEAHHVLTDPRATAIGSFRQTIRLGFTATPDFSVDKTVSRVFGRCIYRMPVREAVEKGLLAPVRASIVRTEVSLAEVPLTRREGDFSPGALEHVIDTVARNRLAVSVYKERYAGERAIVFCCGINHAERVADAFNTEGVSAACIKGTDSPAVRADIRRRFRSGEILALCNADLLIEGVDEERVSVCLNLRPTRSAVMAEQRAGRVLRLDPENPAKIAVVVDFMDEHPRYQPVLYADILQGSARQGGSRGSVLMPRPGSEFSGEPARDVAGLRAAGEIEDLLFVDRVAPPPVTTEHPPASWKTITALAFAIDRNKFRRIRVIVNSFRESHPEWFHFYLDARTVTREHLAPELQSAVEVQLSGEIPPPPGWMNLTQLSQEVRATISDGVKREGRIRTLVKLLREGFSEEFGVYRDPKGRLFEYFSPDVSRMVLEQVMDEEPLRRDTKKERVFPYDKRIFAPVTELADRLGMRRTEVKYFSDFFAENFPGLVISVSDKRVRDGFVFDRAAFLEWVRSVLTFGGELPPPGWLTQQEVCDLFRYQRGVSDVVKDCVTRLTRRESERSDFLHEYVSRDGKGVKPYCSPSLVIQVVRNLLSKEFVMKTEEEISQAEQLRLRRVTAYLAGAS